MPRVLAIGETVARIAAIAGKTSEIVVKTGAIVATTAASGIDGKIGATVAKIAGTAGARSPDTPRKPRQRDDQADKREKRALVGSRRLLEGPEYGDRAYENQQLLTGRHKCRGGCRDHDQPLRIQRA